MNLERVRAIADAVLNEGYILYPYRATATKNRSRWTFGGVYPRAWFEHTEGADPHELATEFLVRAPPEAHIATCVRFLQPLAREVGSFDPPLANWPPASAPDPVVVPMLSVAGQIHHTWQEAVEREFLFAPLRLAELAQTPAALPFACPALAEMAPLADADGLIRGVQRRRQCAQRGRLCLSATHLGEDLWRLSVQVDNTTVMAPGAIRTREEASLFSFASTHLVFAVDGGAFISQQDPPPADAAANAACRNRGLYPVLAGDTGTHQLMLAAPLILYDHPEVAAQSPGNFYDATEIDELLSLTILALTDEEKRAMAAVDPRAAALLARTQALGSEDFRRMHGALQPTSTVLPLMTLERRGRRLNVGDHVRLRPHARGDVLDLVLADKTAVIEAIERDFDDRVHVAVTLDEDPGRDFGLERMPGHRFFFAPEELEALERRLPA